MLVYKFETDIDAAYGTLNADNKFLKEFRKCMQIASKSYAPVSVEITRTRVKPKEVVSCDKAAVGTFNVTLFGIFDNIDTMCELYAQELEKQLISAFEQKDIEVTVTESCLPELFGNISPKDSKLKEEFLKNLRQYIPSDNFCLDYGFIPKTDLTLRAALKEARQLGADESLIAEIRRIYNKNNHRNFVGHPVHYKLSVSCESAGADIAKLLVKCLLANNRLPSTRMDIYSEFKPEAIRDETLRQSLAFSEYSTVIINTSICSDNNMSAHTISELTQQLANDLIYRADLALVIFMDIENTKNYAGELENKLREELPLVEIKEGRLDKLAAGAWLIEASKESPFSDIPGIKPIKPNLVKDKYTRNELYQELISWRRKEITTSLYKPYKSFAKTVSRAKAKKLPTMQAYNELMGLIGLEKVKKIVKQLIATHRVNMMRKQSGLKNDTQALHMIFSGNPGSAKTTVARLLAKIFAEEGITSTDKLVECSRADLVGKYLGWTANMVNEKFQEAMGGVLFIDEAYSLIGEGNDFGKEAISALVQLMENHRDEVIVIFAGYPDKMREFIDQNEGLKSRIAFHLDFPDYSSEEMTGILEQMVSQKDYELEASAKEKCNRILEQAVTVKNFGNGRFARNMVEHAIMSQALRLSENSRATTLSKKELQLLLAEDFEDIALEETHKSKPMGICL